LVPLCLATTSAPGRAEATKPEPKKELTNTEKVVGVWEVNGRLGLPRMPSIEKTQVLCHTTSNRFSHQEVAMRLFRCALLCCLVLGLAGCGGSTTSAPSKAAAGKPEPGTPEAKKELTNKEKIVAIWVVTKSADAPPGALVEFTKDGKINITVKANDKEMKVEGSYTVEEDKINTAVKQGPKEQKETLKIKKLTDTELVTEDEKGKTDEYKKK
jgi:uncharacterized protein (TIGR03066 family)